MTFIYILFILLLSIVFLLFYKINDIPDIISHPSNKIKFQNIFTCYKIPFILQHNFIMLIFGSYSDIKLPKESIIERENIKLKDGGILAIDWYYANKQKLQELKDKNVPIIIALHGVGGHGLENYMKCLCKEASLFDYRIVCINARGTGGSKLLTPRGFHAGKTDDIYQVIKHIKSNNINTKLFGVGYSLGGNILAKYLGEYKDKCLLNAAVLLGNPFDLSLSSAELDKSFLRKKLIDKTITNNLKKWLIPHEHSFPYDMINFHKLKKGKINTVRQFDEEYILPVFKEFKSVDDYYEKNSSSKFVYNIKIPLLILHSKDDLLCPVSSIPYFPLNDYPHITICLTKYGSHVCWLDSVNIFNRHSWGEVNTLKYLNIFA